MSERKKHDFYREYLNDFKRNAAGEYVYCGKVYSFEGNKAEKKSFIIKTVVLSVLCLLFSVLPECLSPTDMSRSFATIIPWGTELVAVLLSVWAAGRMIIRFNELREYIYKKTVLRLPKLLAAGSIFSAVTFVAQLIYACVNGISGEWHLTIIRILSSAVAAVACFIFYRVMISVKFAVKS